MSQKLADYMVSNSVVELVARYGQPSNIPTLLTDYVKDRRGYDYSLHGKAENPTTRFVPDHIVERFCVLGSAEEHVRRIRRLR